MYDLQKYIRLIWLGRLGDGGEPDIWIPGVSRP